MNNLLVHFAQSHSSSFSWFTFNKFVRGTCASTDFRMRRNHRALSLRLTYTTRENPFILNTMLSRLVSTWEVLLEATEKLNYLNQQWKPFSVLIYWWELLNMEPSSKQNRINSYEVSGILSTLFRQVKRRVRSNQRLHSTRRLTVFRVYFLKHRL